MAEDDEEVLGRLAAHLGREVARALRAAEEVEATRYRLPGHDVHGIVQVSRAIRAAYRDAGLDPRRLLG